MLVFGHTTRISEDSAASMFPQVDHQLDQVIYQAQGHDRMGKSRCMYGWGSALFLADYSRCCSYQ